MRAGLVKLGPEHHEWVREDCARKGADRRATASRLPLMLLVVAAFNVRNEDLAFLLVGWLVVAGLVVALPFGRGRQVRLILRRHGLAEPPSVGTALPPGRYDGLAVTAVVAILVVSVAFGANAA